MQKITPCLWFNNNAHEAAEFYTSIFAHSKITTITHYGAAGAKVSGQPIGSIMTVNFILEGQEFTSLNGGPQFTFSPAISFFIHCTSAQEVDTFYEKLSPGGKVFMPLQSYPFSERYAWVADKYGLGWQIILTKEPFAQKIAPCLLFVDKKNGQAQEAIRFYKNVFKKSRIATLVKYGKDQGGTEGSVMYSKFIIEGQEFVAMDGPGTHHFDFGQGISFVVNCKDQKEVDYYWNNLSKDGSENPCGWLEDQWGVSWQITPIQLMEFVEGKDPIKAERAFKAMLTMKKIDIATIEKAAHDQK